MKGGRNHKKILNLLNIDLNLKIWYLPYEWRSYRQRGLFERMSIKSILSTLGRKETNEWKTTKSTNCIRLSITGMEYND